MNIFAVVWRIMSLNVKHSLAANSLCNPVQNKQLEERKSRWKWPKHANAFNFVLLKKLESPKWNLQQSQT